MLQFITHYTDRYTYLDGIRLALAGGCRWIQLRMKEAPADELHSTALQARQLCSEAGATLIIDDHVALAKEIRADGVHLGLNDMPIAEARSILGPTYIIGGTANTFNDVKAHHAAGADYIGCGPFRFTTTKKGLAPVLGLEGYRDIVAQMRAQRIALPVVAIGGITPGDIPALMQTGISGIALSGTILRADDPAEETGRIIEILNQYPPYE